MSLFFADLLHLLLAGIPLPGLWGRRTKYLREEKYGQLKELLYCDRFSYHLDNYFLTSFEHRLPLA